MTAIAPPPTHQGVDPVIIAADAVLARAGAAALDLAALAATTSSPITDLRQRFPTTIDLVIAVLRYRQQQWTNGLAAAASAASDPRDQILTLFGYLESCFADDGWRGCTFINGYGELGRTHPQIAALAAEHLASIHTHLERLCVAAGLPPFIAEGLAMLVNGAKVEAGIRGTTRPARSARMTAAMLISVYDPKHPDRFI